MLCPGDVLDNRYRLTAPIATGGMGEVWRAMDMSLGRTVAVKLLRPELLADPEFDARFQAEARMMAALTHPHVVNVYDYGHAPPTSGGAPYLVMSYVPGVPLSQRIAQAGRLSVTETGSVLIQAAAALHAAHRGGIVHCDVKPANLLVASDGAVTLVDFGVARSATVTTGSTVIGTALYMAPEQVTGRRVSPATDVYALGAVAYHCLSGRPPFTGDTPSEVALRHLSDEPAPLPPDVPAAMRMLVARALRKDPAQRYPSAAAFAHALRQVVAHPDASRSTAADRSLLRHPHRQPRWAAGRVAAAATLLVGGAVALLLGSTLPAQTSPVDRPTTSVPSASAAAVSDAAAPIVATSPTAPVASIGTTPTPPLVVAAPAGQIPSSVAPTDTTTSSPQPLPPPSATTGPSGQPVPPPPSTTASPSPELNPTPSEVSPSAVPSGAPRSS